MGHRNETLRKGAILGAALMLATGRQSRNGGAVIVEFAVQNFIFLATIFLMRDLPDNLEAFLIGFRSGV